MPFLVIFAANSLFNSLYIGVRHGLAAYPLMCVMVGPVLCVQYRPCSRRKTDGGRRSVSAPSSRAWPSSGS